MSKCYKAVELAPGKARLKQSERKGQETPKMTGPLKYEKPKKGTRS